MPERSRGRPESASNSRNMWLVRVGAGLAGAIVILPLTSNRGRALAEEFSPFESPFWVGEGLGVLVLIGILYALSGRWRVLSRRHEAPWRQIDLFLLIFFPLYLMFVANGFAVASGDTLAMRYLPSRILSEGSMDLTGLPIQWSGGVHYSVMEMDGVVLPTFPVGTALLAVPHRALAHWGARDEIGLHLVLRWEKHFAAVAIAFSAVLLFIGVRKLYGEGAALASALLYALATPAFSTASQAMWPFTGELFLLSAGLALLPVRHHAWVMSLAAGIVMGGAFLARPTALVVVLVFVVALSARSRHQGAVVATGATLAMVSCVLWQWRFFGHPLGGYGLMNSGSSVWVLDDPLSFAGTMVSPGRGLLIYMPFLLVLILCVPTLLRRKLLDEWWLGSVAGVGILWVTMSSYHKWWGGYSTGPRLWAEASLLLALLMVPVWKGWTALTAKRPLLLAGIGFAITLQIMSTYNVTARDWSQDRDIGHHNLGPLWEWRWGQLHAILVPGFQYDALAHDPYESGLAAKSFRPAAVVKVGLEQVANSRYDGNSFALPSDLPVIHFPRLDPETANGARELFHFLPRGRPNAVTMCGLSDPVRIALPRQGTWRASAILSARLDDESWPQTHEDLMAGRKVALGSWVVDSSPNDMAKAERIPIMLERDVWAYRPEMRVRPIPPHRIYRGRRYHSDVLVRSDFEVVSDNAGTTTLLLEPAPEGRGCITLMALSLAKRRTAK